MGARSAGFGVLVWVGLCSGTEGALAQSAPGIQTLPPIVVSRTAPSVKPGRAVRTVARPVKPRPAARVVVYPATPISGSGIDIDKVPASVNVVDAAQVDRVRSANIADALQRYVPGIIVNEVTGNPFQPDVQFRGFVASPLRAPQGLAVYQNGVRSTRPSRYCQLGSDPDGRDPISPGRHQQSRVRPQCARWRHRSADEERLQLSRCRDRRMGGSFGRIYGSAQWGKQVDNNWAVYGALEGFTTTASAISRRPTSGASTAMSAIASKATNSTSTWASPTIPGGSSTVPPNCSSNIGVRPIQRRKPLPTRSATQPDQQDGANADLDL